MLKQCTACGLGLRGELLSRVGRIRRTGWAYGAAARIAVGNGGGWTLVWEAGALLNSAGKGTTEHYRLCCTRTFSALLRCGKHQATATVILTKSPDA